MSVLLTDMHKSVVFLAILESCTLSQANSRNVGYTRKTHGIQCVCPWLYYPCYQHCPFSATENWIAMQGDTVPPRKQGLGRRVIFRLTTCQWSQNPIGSDDCGALPTDTGFRRSADGFDSGFWGRLDRNSLSLHKILAQLAGG